MKALLKAHVVEFRYCDTLYVSMFPAMAYVMYADMAGARAPQSIRRLGAAHFSIKSYIDIDSLSA
jgi:hypothetical protein